MILKYLRYRFGYKKAKQILKNSGSHFWDSFKSSKLKTSEKIQNLSGEIADVSLINRFKVLNVEIEINEDKIQNLNEEKEYLTNELEKKSKLKKLLEQNMEQTAQIIGKEVLKQIHANGFKSDPKIIIEFDEKDEKLKDKIIELKQQKNHKYVNENIFQQNTSLTKINQFLSKNLNELQGSLLLYIFAFLVLLIFFMDVAATKIAVDQLLRTQILRGDNALWNITWGQVSALISIGIPLLFFIAYEYLIKHYFDNPKNTKNITAKIVKIIFIAVHIGLAGVSMFYFFVSRTGTNVDIAFDKFLFFLIAPLALILAYFAKSIDWQGLHFIFTPFKIILSLPIIIIFLYILDFFRELLFKIETKMQEFKYHKNLDEQIEVYKEKRNSLKEEKKKLHNLPNEEELAKIVKSGIKDTLKETEEEKTERYKSRTKIREIEERTLALKDINLDRESKKSDYKDGVNGAVYKNINF